MQKTVLLGVFFIVACATVGATDIFRVYSSAAATDVETPLPPGAGVVTAAPQEVTEVPPVEHADIKTATSPLPSTATPAAIVSAPAEVAPARPVALRIPSIALNDTVVPVGLTNDGAMDVPPGNTNNVGWYKYGTVPGSVGSAVLDAHVFAAFSKLNKVKVGSDIYVRDSAGNERHFVVQDVQLYALADVPADVLFNRNDTERLNLITCAGALTKDHSTYTHRLVVYAALVH
jgi:LPXTG-site transpeptidase (sortase) family protein